MDLIYRANARTIAPSMARPPVAALATAPFTTTEVEVADGVLEVVVVLLLEGAKVGAAAAVVPLAAADEAAAHLVQTVSIIKVVPGTAGNETEVVTAVTVETGALIVADTEAVADADADADADAEKDEEEMEELWELPMMWNGYEYWKVAGLLSRVILMPYVWKSRLLGTDHVYDPVFFTPVAMT